MLLQLLLRVARQVLLRQLVVRRHSRLRGRLLVGACHADVCRWEQVLEKRASVSTRRRRRRLEQVREWRLLHLLVRLQLLQ